MLDELELTRHICLLALAVVCAYTDMARGKLYNPVTLGGIALGLVLAALLDAQGARGAQLPNAAIAAVAGGGVLFLVYLTGGLGAGDVKLMAAIGSLSGSWQFVLLALVYTALVGAAIAIGVLIWQGRLWQGLRESGRVLFRLRTKRSKDGPPPTTIPYGVAIAAGAIWAWMERFVLQG